jgi:hypothetical protein
MNTYISLLLTAIVVLVLCGLATSQQQYRCYQCDSGDDPYTCGEKFMDISITKESNCLCCREALTGGKWYRTCEIYSSNCNLPGVCYGDLCNGHEKVASAPRLYSTTSTFWLVGLVTSFVAYINCRAAPIAV